MTNLEKLWGKVTSETPLQENVLMLLKQGHKEYAIRHRLKIPETHWKDIRKILLGKLKFILDSSGIRIQNLPTEAEARTILELLQTTIIVAYCLDDYAIEEVDPYLTYLTDERGLEVEELVICADIKSHFDDQFTQKGASFILMLGESFSPLLQEIKGDLKREKENRSTLYNYFLDQGLIRGRALSLKDQVEWYEKKVLKSNKKK